MNLKLFRMKIKNNFNIEFLKHTLRFSTTQLKISNGCFVLVFRLKTVETIENLLQKSFPWADRLMWPNPEATSYAHNQQHSVLDHKQREYQRTPVILIQTSRDVIGRQIEFNKITFKPIVDPFAVRRLLIEMTTNHDDGRHHIQYAEYTDSDHEFF